MKPISDRVDLREAVLSLDEAIANVAHAGAGGIATFVGMVREQSEGRAVSRLDYSAYDSMAKKEMIQIATDIETEIAGVGLSVLHRLGTLKVGDIAVICAASAPHRGEAFEA
ncbi:MAG: molybdenum cofactor biosynthesis protein MoaE, partial [Polyangiaceae bacterium]